MMAAVSSMDNMYVGLAVIDSVVSCMHVRSVLPIGSGDAAVQAAQPITKQHSNRPSCCACAAMWAANAKVGYAKKISYCTATASACYVSFCNYIHACRLAELYKNIT